MADNAKKLNINRESLRRVELITISGRLDSSNAGELDELFNKCTEAGRHNLVVDLSDVPYMSSAALRAFVSALRRCKNRGGDVRIAAPSERVKEVLALAGLDALFQTYDDTTTAVGSF